MSRRKTEQKQVSEWDRINDDPIILSEYDLKALTLKEDRKQPVQLFDYLRRQLQLSNLSKDEIIIYSARIDTIETWFNMGLVDLANERFFRMLGRLSLNKSVGGFSSLLSLAQVNASAVMQPGQPATMRIGYDQEYEEQREGLFQKGFRKLRGG